MATYDLVVSTGNDSAPLAPFYSALNAKTDVSHTFGHRRIMSAYNCNVWEIAMFASYVDLDGQRCIDTRKDGSPKPLRTFVIAVDLEFGGYRIATLHRKTGTITQRLYASVEDAVRELHVAYVRQDTPRLTLKDVRAWLCDIRHIAHDVTSREWLYRSGQSVALSATVGDMLTATRNKPSRIASNGERERLGLILP